MMVEEIRKGESLYFEDMTALIKEVEERNKQARTLKRKRDSVTINSMVKKSATSQTAITDVYAALLEETTKKHMSKSINIWRQNNNEKVDRT